MKTTLSKNHLTTSETHQMKHARLTMRESNSSTSKSGLNKLGQSAATLLVRCLLPTLALLHDISFAQSMADPLTATNAATLVDTEAKPAGDETHQTPLKLQQVKSEDTAPTNSESNNYRCKIESETSALVDRVRASTQTRLCNTVGWIDGLFGEDEQYDGQEFRGKISLGFREDEVEGLDPRLRVRIKTKLPNVSKRFNAFLGRVEEDSYVANTEVNEDRVNNVGLRSTNDEESEWLFGLGYRGPSADYNGWDYSVGAKISSGFKPYTRAAYRHLHQFDSGNYLKSTQTVFWRKQDGFGISSNADYTRLIGENDIVVTHGSVKYTEELKKLEWFADTRWHHSFSSKRGVSSSIYIRGEAENDVPIPEYGVTFTYIQPILRDWLFLETGLDWRWERETRAQTSYKSAVRFGIQLEMLMGDYYQRGRRK